MKILISGSDGVIGKEITNKLKKNKRYKLFLLSNKKKKRKLKNNINFIQQDITKPIKLKTKIDALIHCAAKHPFSLSGNSMKKIYKINVKMTKNLIEFSNKNNIKKVFFLSSIDVYGQIQNNIVNEKQKPKKANLYGKSKFFSEKLFCKKNNQFRVICLRIPGVFTLDLSKNHPLIINIVKRIMHGQNIHVYNINKKFNNVLDADEIIRFIKIALKRPKYKSGVYNFSASKPIKFIKVLKLIKKVFKSKSQIIEHDSRKTSFIISNKKLIKSFSYKISSTEKIIKRCCKKLLKKNYVFT